MARRPAPAKPKALLRGGRKNRVVGHENIDPKALLAHPNNWRIHPDHQRAMIRGSLDAVGWAKSVQVQVGTNVIVDGHARVFIAVQDGEAEVPVEWVDLNNAEVATMIAALDPISQLAEADYDKLGALIAGGVVADNEAIQGLFDQFEAEISDAVAMREQYENRDGTNFKSVQKAFAERKAPVTIVLAVEEAEEVERAFNAVGEINRAKAFLTMVRFWYEHNGPEDEPEDEPSTPNNPGGPNGRQQRGPANKLDRNGQEDAAARIAREIGAT